MSKVRFYDWRAAHADAAHIPNAARLIEQAEALADVLRTSAPGEEQARDADRSLSVGDFPRDTDNSSSSSTGSVRSRTT